MSAPARILSVYDGQTYLGEIRDFVLGLEAVTADGRDVGTFVKVADAATAISQAMAGKPEPAS